MEHSTYVFLPVWLPLISRMIVVGHLYKSQGLFLKICFQRWTEFVGAQACPTFPRIAAALNRASHCRRLAPAKEKPRWQRTCFVALVDESPWPSVLATA